MWIYCCYSNISEDISCNIFFIYFDVCYLAGCLYQHFNSASNSSFHLIEADQSDIPTCNLHDGCMTFKFFSRLFSDSKGIKVNNLKVIKWNLTHLSPNVLLLFAVNKKNFIKWRSWDSVKAKWFFFALVTSKKWEKNFLWCCKLKGLQLKSVSLMLNI